MAADDRSLVDLMADLERSVLEAKVARARLQGDVVAEGAALRQLDRRFPPPTWQGEAVEALADAARAGQRDQRDEARSPGAEPLD